MKKIYLSVDIWQTVYLVLASKREGYKDNVVLKCKVEKILIDVNGVKYVCCPVQVVCGEEKDIEKYVSSFCFCNANIDTGLRGMEQDNKYPVFTEKGDCIAWLKNETR